MVVDIEFSSMAVKDLKKLDHNSKKKILAAIESLPNIYSQQDIKKLKGTDSYRLRAGNYRIIFTRVSQVILIMEIKDRKDIYKKK